MYIRFITEFTNEWDEQETGVFQALGVLINSDEPVAHDLRKLEELRTWFNNNLDRPKRFNKHSNRHKSNVAISWFKDSAQEHLAKMYELMPILKNYNIIVEVIRSENPGYKVFEDDFQVVTIPYGKEKSKVL